MLLSKSLIQKICENISAHNSVRTSYLMEGVTDTEFALLMEEAEANPLGQAAKFLESITMSEAIAEAEGVAAVNALAATGHAGAIMWRQERRYGASWGKGEAKGKETAQGASAAPQILLPINGRETPTG